MSRYIDTGTGLFMMRHAMRFCESLTGPLPWA
jgi:hypothetical protein